VADDALDIDRVRVGRQQVAAGVAQGALAGRPGVGRELAAALQVAVQPPQQVAQMDGDDGLQVAARRVDRRRIDGIDGQAEVALGGQGQQQRLEGRVRGLVDQGLAQGVGVALLADLVGRRRPGPGSARGPGSGRLPSG
jgi:hypothetical protein